MGEISDIINEHKEEFISIRREFHAIPELGFNEYKTTDKIEKYLQKWGLKVYSFEGSTGTVGTLGENTDNETIGIRADIDALPIWEKTGFEYASQNEGIMHACGHDGHIAIALGTAKILSLLKDRLKVNVKFIFQPAEETAKGAKMMIENRVLENPNIDTIIGLHIYPNLDSGIIGVKEGPMMAAADKFNITVKGKGGHGAMPHKSVDPIVIATEIISNFQKIISRELDPLKSVVISIGTINAGTKFNIIPDELNMSGTVRSFEPDVREYIKKRIEEIVKNVTKGSGGSYEFEYLYGVPAVINDIETTKKIRTILKKSIGEDCLIEIEPAMISEDFAEFQLHVPGTFMFLGTYNKDKGITMPLHHPEYTIDEEILAVGIRAFCEIVLNYK